MARKDFAALESRRASGASGQSAARDALRQRMENPTSLRLQELQPNPANPRYADDDPEVQDLAITLTRVGQLQPALVVPLEQYLQVFPDQRSAVGPQPWVVIVGNRRLAAARAADRPTLDVRVAADLDSVEAFEDRILIENLQRKDLPPLLEAEHLRRRLDRPGETFRSVGEAIGKSHAYVQQRLELLKLIPELQSLLRDGTLTIKTGRLVGGLPEEEQRARYEQGPPYLDRRSASSTPDRGRPAGNPVANDPPVLTTEPTAASGGTLASDGTQQRGQAPEPAAGPAASPEPAANEPSPVNRVATPADAERSTEDPGEPTSGAHLARVLMHVDNALAELDAALPGGGNSAAGDALAESQRHLTAARQALTSRAPT